MYTAWSVATQGSPSGNSTFIVTQAQATMSVGDYFTFSNQGNILFTVTAVAVPVGGFVNVSFSPSVPSPELGGNTATQVFTSNLCTNPSFEANLTGWTSLSNAVLKQDHLTAQAGLNSLSVATPGVVPGEGVRGPTATFPAAVTASVSLWLMAQSGTVNVAAVGTAGAILSQIEVPLNGIFQQVTLNGLSITAGGTLQVIITTPTVQSLPFWVDAVQYEPESPAQPYVDGDQNACFWTSAAELSASYQPFPFPVADQGLSTFTGSVSIIQQGKVFGAIPTTDVGISTFTGTAAASSANPVAAFNDFGIFALTDPDPAQTYVSWNDAGIMSGYNDYNLSYAMFIPPQDFIASNGQFLWHRAAFAAFGWSFASLAAGAAQNITDVQAEFCLLNGANPILPSPFQPPRQLQVSIKADRVNYVPNPSFAVSTQFWSPTGPGVSLIEDVTQGVPNLATYASVLYSNTTSMQVVLTAGTDSGAMITIPNLVIGRTYIASAYIQTGAGLDDVIMNIANGITGIAQLGGIPYGGDPAVPGYGQSNYGGIQPPPGPLAPVTWTRISTVFVADADNEQLQIAALVDPAATFPVHFWVDAVLIEDGEILQPYFDGSFGVDAFWAAGGTPGLSQSYYAAQEAQRMNMVNNVLARNIPLGISFAPPVFGTPFTG